MEIGPIGLLILLIEVGTFVDFLFQFSRVLSACTLFMAGIGLEFCWWVLIVIRLSSLLVVASESIAKKMSKSLDLLFWCIGGCLWNHCSCEFLDLMGVRERKFTIIGKFETKLNYV